MSLSDKLKIKILKKEISLLQNKVDMLEKENLKLKQIKDKASEINEIISFAEESKDTYDRLSKEIKLMMNKYKKDLNKLLK